ISSASGACAASGTTAGGPTGTSEVIPPTTGVGINTNPTGQLPIDTTFTSPPNGLAEVTGNGGTNPCVTGPTGLAAGIGGPAATSASGGCAAGAPGGPTISTTAPSPASITSPGAPGQ